MNYNIYVSNAIIKERVSKEKNSAVGDYVYGSHSKGRKSA